MARKRTKTNRINPGDVDILMDLIVSKDGKVVRKKTEKCYSFVDNFLKCLYGQMTRDGTQDDPDHFTLDIVNTSNSIITMDFDSDSSNGSFACGASSSDDTYGIVIGQGTTSPAIDDYYLQSVIEDGTGANQLQYSAVSFGAPATDASTSTVQVTRVFTNASGSSITIAEVGLVGGAGNFDILLLRDVLPSIETVNNGEDFTINYKIKATV